MSKPKITKTIVQKIDDDGNVVSETVTTIEIKPVESDEQFGLYL